MRVSHTEKFGGILGAGVLTAHLSTRRCPLWSSERPSHSSRGGPLSPSQSRSQDPKRRLPYPSLGVVCQLHPRSKGRTWLLRSPNFKTKFKCFTQCALFFKFLRSQFVVSSSEEETLHLLICLGFQHNYLQKMCLPNLPAVPA